MRAAIRGTVTRARRLWDRARREHSTPREIAFAVSVGVFAGCMPFLGFRGGIAVGLATLLRLNRLWAFAGSRLLILPLFVGIGFCEIESGHRLRTGAWAALSTADVAARGSELLTDWLIGTPAVGGGVAALAGIVTYAAARRWRWGVTPGTRGGSRPSSSESPPSAPPTPRP
jgi:uncharacterized protein